MKSATWLILGMMLSGFAFARQYNVIWNFGSVPNDGWQPEGALVSDQSGNLYGTTRIGGVDEGGIVFQLHQESDGTWTEAIIYRFCSVIANSLCTDGANPAAGLVFDGQGNLYGTTMTGGGFCTITDSCGTVFELSPPNGNMQTWTEKVLYNFCSDERNGLCLDGNFPLSQLVFDTVGNMYGTTEEGGMGHWGLNNGAGTIFELSPSAKGWVHNTLYNFCTQGSGNACPDGAKPVTGLTFDRSGNLYGTTENGGGSRGLAFGTIYELSSNGGGWTFAVVYSFAVPIGPGASVSFDGAGNLYSTTKQGGVFGAGNVFRVSANHMIRQVSFNGTNGNQPYSGVIVDSRNNVFGTTSAGGTGFGNIFRIGPSGGLTVLYNFCSQTNCTDGELPQANLLETETGKIYGSTIEGGANNQGVVFEVIP